MKSNADLIIKIPKKGLFMINRKIRQTTEEILTKSEKVLLEYFRKEIKVKNKGTKKEADIVTEADEAAEKIIIDIVKEKMPRHSILSEEQGKIDNHSDYKWIIDPLDGTHNFLYGIPIFGTTVALEYKNKIIFSAVNIPLMEGKVFAEKGQGVLINGKPGKVSRETDIKKTLMEIYGLWKWHENEFRNLFNKIIKRFYTNIRVFGCMAWTSINLAMGRTEGCVGYDLSPWDLAPAMLIVREAGGEISDFQGNKPNYHNGNILFANNKKTLNRILECIDPER